MSLDSGGVWDQQGFFKFAKQQVRTKRAAAPEKCGNTPLPVQLAWFTHFPPAHVQISSGFRDLNSGGVWEQQGFNKFAKQHTAQVSTTWCQRKPQGYVGPCRRAVRRTCSLLPSELRQTRMAYDVLSMDAARCKHCRQAATQCAAQGSAGRRVGPCRHEERRMSTARCQRKPQRLTPRGAPSGASRKPEKGSSHAVPYEL